MPRIVNHDVKVNLDLDKLPENKEDFQLIWLDARLAKSSDTLATQKLLRLLNTNAQFYTDAEKCLEIILSIQTEHVLLVVSGSLARIILPRIQNIRSIRAIFVFCETAELHSNLLLEYPRKIVDIYTDRDKLIESISDTMKLIEKQDMAFSLFDHKQKSTRDLTKESASFLWNQLLIDVLRKMPTDDQAKNEMLDYCSAYYRNNKEELKKIDNFRTSYTPNDAIKYYTADSFLYRLLNKALRTEDITLLYIFRFFIIDLCARLDDGKEQLSKNESGSLILYRCQRIPKEEFENLKNNIGSLIAINGFLSTSRVEKVSLQFSMSPLSALNDNMIQVQMIIKADPTTLKKVIFADISHQSEFKLEQEVLFSLGAVFRIDECEFDETLSMGKLLLTATDEGSATLQSYLDLQKHQLQIYTPLIYFGRLLMNEMNEVDRAGEYFQMLLKTLPNDHPDIAEVYNQIGAVHYMNAHKLIDRKKDFELSYALEMFEKALDMRQKMFGDNDIHIAFSFNNIGSVYNDRQDFERALNYYERGLQIVENNKIEASIFKANLLCNCGVLKDRMGDDEAALSFYIRADDMYSQYLPIHHPICEKSASSIAALCEKMSDHNGALKYFRRNFEYCKAMLLPTDEKFEDSWLNVVRYSLKLGFEQEAITYLDQVLKICERGSSYMQETSNEYIWCMTQLCEYVMKFDLALNYYKILVQSDRLKLNNFSSIKRIKDNIDDKFDTKYIEILKFRLSTYEELLPTNNVQHASFLMDIGQAFRFINSNNLTYQCYQKAFDILEVQPILVDTKAFLDSWRTLVDIYFHNNDEQSMLSILERALKKCEELSNNEMSGTYFIQYIADKFEMNDDISHAVHYLEKAFTYAEATCSYDDIRSQLQKLLRFYLKTGQEQKVEIYIQRAVNVCEKDPVELCWCHWIVGDWYRIHGMEDKAFQHYEYLLIATERNYLSSKKVLDNIWIDFVLAHPFGTFRFSLRTERMNLDILMSMCRRHLPSLHFKKAILLWEYEALHEEMQRKNAALDVYMGVTETFEKLIYKHDDTRTKQALHYLLSRHQIYANTHDCCPWLKSYQLPHRAMFNFTSAHDKWKCILQRLKMLKMAHIDDQWEFHLKIEYSVLNPELCNILLCEFLQVCRTITHSDENNTSLDTYSIICCLESISHWYLNRGQCLESLFYRQCQLEFEMKIFKMHPHVAWSLWFIGLICQKMTEYNLTLGYFDRAFKIFESKHQKKHNDIQKLEEQISQTKQIMYATDITDVNKSFIKLVNDQQPRCNLKILQVPFHID